MPMFQKTNNTYIHDGLRMVGRQAEVFALGLRGLALYYTAFIHYIQG